MAETEVGKTLEKLIVAGEKLVEAAKEVKDVIEALKQSQVPPDDQPEEKP